MSVGNLPAGIKKQIKRNLPAEAFGLKLYPVIMEDYEDYIPLRAVLLMRMSTLPAEYAAMNFLDAIWKMDCDAYKMTGEFNGFTAAVIRILSLALRLDAGGIDVETEAEDVSRIKGLKVSGTLITAKDFALIRQIIAAQNGDGLPDESENPELVQAEADIAASRCAELKIDAESEIAAVAAAMRIRKKDIYAWPVKEFRETAAAISLAKQHMICAIAETNGCKWPNGNPAPSWRYERRAPSHGSMIAFDSFRRAHGNINVSDSAPVFGK